MNIQEERFIQQLIATNAHLSQQIASLTAQVTALTELAARQNEQLHKNSKNSSKPPSSDGLKKTKTRSLRKSTEKKPDAQKNHKGTGLKLPHKPDELIDCEPNECLHCPNAQLCTSKVKESRYEIDLKTVVMVRQSANHANLQTAF